MIEQVFVLLDSLFEKQISMTNTVYNQYLL